MGSLLGEGSRRDGAPRLLLIKARIENHRGEASAPAQGTLYLGAVARALGWDVRSLDTYLVGDEARATLEALREFPADVVGVSALTAESKSLHAIAAVARRAAPRALMLAGGPHASAEPEKTAADPSFDAVVIGEGERTLEDVLMHVTRRQGIKNVPGICARDTSGTPYRTASRPYVQDLDELPMPAWDLTDADAYQHRRGMSLAGLRRYMPISTSRGCPYRCSYCHDIHGKRFRSHSPLYVLRMIDDLRARGIHHFDITDDIFNFDAERMMEICDGLIERGGIGFTCPNGVRADRMNLEQVDKMARAGCEYVAIAIETATPRLQKQIRKHLRFDKVQPIISAFTQRNVFTSGFFMVGFPSETESELRATIDFALRSQLHAAYFFVVTPFGGTEMHEQVVTGMSAAAAELTGSGMYFRPVKNLSQVPDRLFYKIRREAYLRFYIDSKRIRRIWSAHPRRRNLIEYFATMFLRDALRIDVGRWLNKLSSLGRAERSGLPVADVATPPSAPLSTIGSELVQLRRTNGASRKPAELESRGV